MSDLLSRGGSEGSHVLYSEARTAGSAAVEDSWTVDEVDLLQKSLSRRVLKRRNMPSSFGGCYLNESSDSLRFLPFMIRQFELKFLGTL